MGRRRFLQVVLTAMLLVLAMPVTRAFADDTVPVYRMYNTKTSEHLYTRSAAEYAACGTGGYVDWLQEGVAWEAPKAGATGAKPVWRLYNRKSGDHHYTTSKAEKASLLASGDWRDEGTAFWSGGDVRVYRVYNGRLRRGQHHYTTSSGERDALVARFGWRDEGVGFRAVRLGRPIDPNKPQYSYELYVLGGTELGNKFYVGNFRPLYVKTDNPDPSTMELACTAWRTTTSVQLDDVEYLSDEYMHNFYRVQGGYLYFGYFGDNPKTGAYDLGSHTITIKENGMSALTAKIFVVDPAVEESAWIDQVIAEQTTAGMNPLEKMEAVTEWLQGDAEDGGAGFKYLYNDENGRLLHLARYKNSPYWIYRHTDSMESPGVLCKFAQHIGGFEDIHNCYPDPDWSMHYLCRVTYEGEDYYFAFCPMAYTGQVNRSDIEYVDFSDTSWMLRLG